MSQFNYTSNDFPFQPFTKIYSADVNDCFTDIKTFFNVTKLTDDNLQDAGITRSTKLKVGTKNAVIINDNSAGAMGELAPGSIGQILTSAGSSSPPTFANPPSSGSWTSNIGLSSSEASSALTLAMKQSDGSTNPSSTAPSQLSFRSSTAATGLYNIRSVTAALSLTVPSGATLGHVNGLNGYIYLYAIDNAGTVELAVSGIRFFSEASLQTTTTIGAGSTSGNILYSATGRSNVPVRFIGRFKSNQTTAGTWAAALLESSIANASFAKTEIIMAKYYNSIAGSSTNTTPVQFDTKVFDTHGVYENDSSAKFIAPIDGYAKITCNIGSANNIPFSVYKNGSDDSQIVSTQATGTGNGTVIISVVAGDYLDVRKDSGSGSTITASSVSTWATYELLAAS